MIESSIAVFVISRATPTRATVTSALVYCHVVGDSEVVSVATDG